MVRRAICINVGMYSTVQANQAAADHPVDIKSEGGRQEAGHWNGGACLLQQQWGLRLLRTLQAS